jgi:hypothetical protein
MPTLRLEWRGAGQHGWRVLAGTETEPIQLGFIEPTYSLGTGRRNGQWDAITDDRHKLFDDPWRDRNTAILQLIDPYEHTATRPSRSKASRRQLATWPSSGNIGASCISSMPAHQAVGNARRVVSVQVPPPTRNPHVRISANPRQPRCRLVRRHLKKLSNGEMPR